MKQSFIKPQKNREWDETSFNVDDEEIIFSLCKNETVLKPFWWLIYGLKSVGVDSRVECVLIAKNEFMNFFE